VRSFKSFPIILAGDRLRWLDYSVLISNPLATSGLLIIFKKYALLNFSERDIERGCDSLAIGWAGFDKLRGIAHRPVRSP
jgi:hypothetical protein